MDIVHESECLLRGYESQTLCQARIDSRLMQEELFAKWGSKMIAATWFTQRMGTWYCPINISTITWTVVRPGLIEWNLISRSHTLEQMLEEIGELVYRWKRKEVVE